MGYIYKITNNINDKVYIGQTKTSLEIRFKRHLSDSSMSSSQHSRPLYSAMNKYGKENFSIHLIEECDNSLLDDKEIFYIKQFNSYGSNGYNATLGGSGSKQIISYDDIYNLWKNNYSIVEIVNTLNISSKWVSNILKSLYGVSSEDISTRGMLKNNKKSDFKQIVFMQTADGVNIGVFSSMYKAAQYLLYNKYTKGGIGGIRCNIRYTCKNVKKSSYGFKWASVEGDLCDFYFELPCLDLPDKIQDRSSTYRRINRYTKTGNYIDTFKSVLSAEDTIHKNSSHIGSVCKGKRKSAHGYIWRYTSEEFPEGKDIKV